MTEPAAPNQQVHVDLLSFNYDERLELSREFDCDFRDLAGYLAAKFGGGKVDTDTKLRDAEGKVRFAEEVLRYAVWITRRRTDPEAQLGEFDGGDYTVLADTIRRPKAGSPQRTGRSKRT